MIAFAIHSKRTVIGDQLKDATVFIRDGKITKIQEGEPEVGDLEVIDISNNILMPGVIDPHVHINEPGRTHWEGFETATKAAIVGGISTLVDMPLNASPVTTTVSALKEKLAAATPNMYTNVGFWGGIVPGNEREIEPLIDQGVLGFKAFLTHSGIDDFPNVQEDDLRKAMPLIAKYQLPLLVHCELTSPNLHQTTDERSYHQYLSSRPCKWEDDAIALMIQLCKDYRCPVHIVHLSSASAIQKIAEAKSQGLPLTVETAQHYLFFNAEDIPDGATAFKCAPPIREKANNDLLWDALKSGIIDLVATDHSPAPPELKELQSGSYVKAWGGISSIQLALPVLWTAARKRGCSITDVSRWLSANPAVLAGLEDTKGKIAIGYDADLIVFNDDQNFVVNEENLYHRHKVTPYLHRLLTGVVEQTYIAGNLVHDQGNIRLLAGQPIFNKYSQKIK